jgi:hypothetical protein
MVFDIRSEVFMARLKVQDVATQRGLNLSQLQAAVNRRLPATGEPVAMGTIRRYWYATRDGKEQGKPIEQVDIHLLGTIAKALQVRVSELLNEDELGQMAAV